MQDELAKIRQQKIRSRRRNDWDWQERPPSARDKQYIKHTRPWNCTILTYITNSSYELQSHCECFPITVHLIFAHTTTINTCGCSLTGTHTHTHSPVTTNTVTELYEFIVACTHFDWGHCRTMQRSTVQCFNTIYTR